MSTATRVPETVTISGDELSADDAVTTLRRYGRWKLVKNSFIRFRYADGFTNARALALQFCLAFIPLIIAVVGLSSALHHEKFARVVTETLGRVLPGRDKGDMMQEAAQQSSDRGATGGQLALWLGLLAAIIALTTAMGQIERGANRIYGIERDHPALRKYGRALLMALTAGLLSLLGFLVIIAGDALGESLATVYGWNDLSVTLWRLGRHPGLGVVHRRLGALTATQAAGVLVAGVRIRCVACALAARHRLAGALCSVGRVVRHHLWPIDRSFRPVAVGQSVVGGALPRYRIRRPARGCPRRCTNADFG